MKRASVELGGEPAGMLEEHELGRSYVFRYHDGYNGPPISLTLPTTQREYVFQRFPPFLDGLLPEGVMLEALLRQNKIDANDYLSQLIVVGADLVGAITVREVP